MARITAQRPWGPLYGLPRGLKRSLWPIALFLTLAAVLAAGRGFGADAISMGGLPNRQVIAAADLVAAGEQAVRQQLSTAPGDDVTVSAVMPPHSLLGPAGEIAFDAAVRRPVLPGGLWVAEVTARSGDWSVSATIRYRVHVAADVLVTRRALKRYQTLTDADVSLEKRELGALRGEPVRDVAELLGRWAARPVSAGAVVTADWLEPVPLVRRAQVITATVHLGGVSASTPVIALRDGRLGEVIPVRAQSGTSGQAHAPEFEARVVAPGRVEVLSP